MNILNTIFINVRKLRIKTKNAMFLILPISILVLSSVILTSQVQNIRDASAVSIFDTIKDQSRLINLQKEVAQTTFGGGGGMMQMMDSSDRTFNEGDLYTIQSIDGVSSAQINTSIPITNVKTSNLFDGLNVKVNNITGLDEGLSTIYSEDSLNYTEGQPIPIILNASTFVENYEEWGDKTEFSMDFRSMRDQMGTDTDPRELMESLSPIKTRSIDYDKDELIGQTFTISFGGLDDIADYTTDHGDSGPVMRKLTDEEIQTKIDNRTTAVSEYWDYEKISTPITYTFKVVGVIEDSTDTNSYVPAAFVDKVMQDYISNQLNAKVIDEIPTDVLNSSFTGLSYDGTELTESMNAMIFGGMRGGGFGMRMEGGRPGEEQSAESPSLAESYNIPGLIIEVSSDGQGTVVGEYTDANVFTEATKTGTSIAILTETVGDRVNVIDTLNDLGYAYQDLSDMEVFAELENTLDKFSSGFLTVFVVLIIGLVMITMGKFVSDSRKEIGIFRAIGVTKGGIVTLFLSQSLIYAGVGLAIGLSAGFFGNLLISGVVNSWFTGFVNDTVAESFNVVMQADASIFRNVNWSAVGMYSAILAGITFFTALIPAYKASSVSPVEAIRND